MLDEISIRVFFVRLNRFAFPPFIAPTLSSDHTVGKRESKGAGGSREEKGGKGETISLYAIAYNFLYTVIYHLRLYLDSLIRPPQDQCGRRK